MSEEDYMALFYEAERKIESLNNEIEELQDRIKKLEEQLGIQSEYQF